MKRKPIIWITIFTFYLSYSEMVNLMSSQPATQRNDQLVNYSIQLEKLFTGPEIFYFRTHSLSFNDNFNFQLDFQLRCEVFLCTAGSDACSLREQSSRWSYTCKIRKCELNEVNACIDNSLIEFPLDEHFFHDSHLCPGPF